MQNAVLILSQETKERLAEELLLRHADLSLSTSLSLALSCFALSVSNVLFLCLSLVYSVSPSSLSPCHQLNLSPLSLSFSPSFLHSFSFCLAPIFFLFSHSQSQAGSDSLYLSPPFLLCVFFLFSFNLSLSLSRTHSLTRSDSLHLYHSRTTRAQHHT